MQGLLFSELGPLSGYLADLERGADQLVGEMAEDELLKRPVEETADTLHRRLMPQVPSLLLDRMTPKRDIISGEAFMVFTIPFSGTAALFRYTPEGKEGDPPTGTVVGALTIAVEMKDRESDAIVAAYWDIIERIRANLHAISAQLAPFESSLHERLTARLVARRDLVLHQRAVAEDVVLRLSSTSGSLM